MHKLVRPSEEPSALAEARSLRCEDWNALGLGRPNAREEVQLALLLMQNEKCAYCECKLDMHDGHIEHFKRRKWFPELTFAWNNLYYSCCRNGTCGRHKDRVLDKSRVDELIDPCVDDPEDYLQFTFDGNVSIREGLSEERISRAALTIDVFNLKHLQLVEMRLNTLRSFEWLKQMSATQIDAYLDELPLTTPFLTAIYHYFGRRFSPVEDSKREVDAPRDDE